MEESSLRRRLDAALVLLVANFLLLLALALRYVTETAVGLLVIAALLGYGFFRDDWVERSPNASRDVQNVDQQLVR